MAVAGAKGGGLADRRVGRFVAALLIFGAVVLLAAAIAVAWSLAESRDRANWVNHTYQVQAELAAYRSLVEQTENARRGMILSDSSSFTQRAIASEAALAPALDRIAALTRDNAPQQAGVAALRGHASQQRALLAQTLSAVRTGNFARAAATFETDGAVAVVSKAQATLAAMEREEANLLVGREADRDWVRAIFYSILAGTGLVVLVVTGASLLVTWRSLTTAWGARDELRGLNADLEGAVAERTADLSRANEEIQRFAYIVSHDLRSPLVNVMGFTAELQSAIKPLDELIARADAEAPGLVTSEARLAAREDLPEAIGFIRTSTQKMDRLINAILGLSRQGRRVLSPEPIDVAAMIGSIVETLAHRIEEVGAEVDIAGELPALFHDRLAIEQILANLIENAVKYRHPGRPLTVRVSGSAASGRAAIAVADNGRGIEARDLSRIFDLFRRSGAQTEPGEGIGLAHVRALAHRLGGTIDCRSEIGQGSTFTLTLPEKFAGEGTATV